MCHTCAAKNPKPSEDAKDIKDKILPQPTNALTVISKSPKNSIKALAIEDQAECSEMEPSNSGLVMIDTTKTANQKRKEAAAARRNEKFQQKQNAKIAVSVGASTIQMPASNTNG